MKTNLDYYRHDADCHNSGQIRVLRNRFGYDGEAKFWILKNHIAKAPHCWLDVKNRHIRVELCGDLGFTAEELEEYITYLTGEECGILIQDKNSKISTEDVQDLLKKVYIERRRGREKYESGKKDEPEEQTATDTPRPPKNAAWKEKVAQALVNNKKNPERTKEKFLKHCVDLGHCDIHYAKKTWQQGMEIQRQYKDKLWEKITVFLLFAEGANSKHIALYQEIVGFVNDFHPRNERPSGAGSQEEED